MTPITDPSPPTDALPLVADPAVEAAAPALPELSDADLQAARDAHVRAQRGRLRAQRDPDFRALSDDLLKAVAALGAATDKVAEQAARIAELEAALEAAKSKKSKAATSET